MIMLKLLDIREGVITDFVNLQNVVRGDVRQLPDGQYYAVAQGNTSIGHHDYALAVGPYRSFREAKKNFAADFINSNFINSIGTVGTNKEESK